jgi:hypothetical protein
MKKLALISLSLATFGIAAAQPAPPAKTPASPPPAKGAPATPPGADKKLPAPTSPPATTMPVPAKPPAPPKELTDLAKSMAGTWRCTGQAMVGETMVAAKSTVVHKVDATLNKFWIQTAFTGTIPKMPAMKSTWYTTYDSTKGKLWRSSMQGRGGYSTAWGTVADKKISWEGDAHWADGSDVKLRTTEEMVSPKEVKVSGESSKDGGKTWAKELEVTCKK